MTSLEPSRLFDMGFGFMASKVLLSAVGLDVFTHLSGKSMTGAEMAADLSLHDRAIPDFPDTLVALGLLDRDGDGPQARYRNAPEAAAFLDKNSPDYVGAALEMCNDRLYRFWSDLTEGLQTGLPQNEIKHTGQSMFEELYREPARLEQFIDSMSGFSTPGFRALADTFDFTPFQTVCDVGGASGQLAIILASTFEHLHCITFDLPAIEHIATRKVHDAGLADRVDVVSGDFFTDPLPAADVIVMAQVLHDWNLDKKRQLIRSAYQALPPEGVLIVIEIFIDDARREDALALMESLNMLIEFGEAFNFTVRDLRNWCNDIGFQRLDFLALAEGLKAAIAQK